MSDEAPRSFGYNPALDGLRAFAILAVIAYHCSFDQRGLNVWGGWLGVDLFFVLSGFLITTLLLREHQRFARVSLRSFYMRRVLRLYPLIVVSLLVATFTMVWLQGSSGARTHPVGIAAIAFYFVNWADLWHRSAPVMGLFSHFWSLSIEEQFYVVWPVVVIVALRWRHRYLALLTLSAGLATAIALTRSRMVWTAYRWQRHNPYAYGLLGAHRTQAWNTWYLSSWYHGDGLLVGCCLAVLLVLRTKPFGRSARISLTVAAFGAAGGLLWIGHLASKHQQWPPIASLGMPAFEVCAAILVAHLVVTPVGTMARGLSWRPLVWTGRRAYGLYVIHPVALVLVQRELGHRGGWPIVAALATAFGLAALSYRFIEQPALRLKRRFTPANTEARRAAGATSG